MIWYCNTNIHMDLVSMELSATSFMEIFDSFEKLDHWILEWHFDHKSIGFFRFVLHFFCMNFLSACFFRFWRIELVLVNFQNSTGIFNQNSIVSLIFTLRSSRVRSVFWTSLSLLESSTTVKAVKYHISHRHLGANSEHCVELLSVEESFVVVPSRQISWSCPIQYNSISSSFLLLNKISYY